MVAINDSLIDYGYKVTFRVVLILLINRALTLGLGCALGNKLALCVAGQTEMAKCFAKFIKKNCKLIFEQIFGSGYEWVILGFVNNKPVHIY